MASDNQREGGLGDDFFEQMLPVPVPVYSGGAGETVNYVGGSGGSNHHHHGGSNQHQHHHRHHGGSMVSGVGEGDGSSYGPGAVGFGMSLPLGLNLETGSVSSFLKAEDGSGKSCVGDVGDGVAAIPTCSSGIHNGLMPRQVSNGLLG